MSLMIAPTGMYRVIRWVGHVPSEHGDFATLPEAAAHADTLFDEAHHITSGVFNQIGKRVWFCGEPQAATFRPMNVTTLAGIDKPKRRSHHRR